MIHRRGRVQTEGESILVKRVKNRTLMKVRVERVRGGRRWRGKKH